MTELLSQSIPPPPSHIAVVVRSLLAVKPEERQRILKDVEYNIFAFPAGLLTCDYLSDSGTSAMTDVQWAACEYFMASFESVAKPGANSCRHSNEGRRKLWSQLGVLLPS